MNLKIPELLVKAVKAAIPTAANGHFTYTEGPFVVELGDMTAGKDGILQVGELSIVDQTVSAGPIATFTGLQCPLLIAYLELFDAMQRIGASAKEIGLTDEVGQVTSLSGVDPDYHMLDVESVSIPIGNGLVITLKDASMDL
ncbi:MAG TPA: hypothetical protein VNG90_01110 [Candidatus Acidoferrum sp.]|nr:hypothetical protein [Candidatus Acidoferrum sp.]